ncbi:restless-like transposase [Apiospora kogelbergensis]|uniref:Restless-like transposase n=1 Tax=Apiospora kogelbergensis TaxID=1337665 RepID=A0AAW0QZH2_9PEZI
MPSYRAAANTVLETDETHQVTIFRFYPGWSLSERVRDTSAWVWQFGFDIQRAKERRWVCKHCIILGTSSPADFAPAGLQNAAGHLYRRHYINAPPGMAMSREEKRATARTSKPHNTIANYLDLSAEKPAEQAVINKIIQQFDRQRFQQLLVEWIVNESLPFSTAEHPGLRAIFEYLNPQVLVQQANLSRVSIKPRIKEQYCMPEMPGRHLGEEIARVVGDVTTEFEIDGKIGVCVTDNAAGLGGSVAGVALVILNLAAKLLLYGNAEQRVDTFIERQEQLTDAEYNLWWKEGPVGKLRILVIAIDTSDRLTAAFQHIQQADINNAETERARSKKPLHLVKDNQTRWLGSLYMIRRALRVRIYFEQLKVKYKLQWEQENRGRDGHLRPSAAANIPVFLDDDNWLSGNDWVALEHVETILTSFESVLKKLEGDGQIRHRATGLRGSYGNVWDVLPSYEFLLKQLEDTRRIANGIPDPIQFKFYYASLAFHPAYGWAKISHFWDRHPDWLAKAKAIVKSHWEREYKTRPTPPDLIPSAPTPTGFAPSQAACRINEVDAFLQQGQLQGDRALEINDDEMEAWIAERPDPFDQYAYHPGHVG